MYKNPPFWPPILSVFSRALPPVRTRPQHFQNYYSHGCFFALLRRKILVSALILIYLLLERLPEPPSNETAQPGLFRALALTL
jgi:hypothetical protein